MLAYYLSLVDSPEEKSTVEEIYHEYKNLILFLALSKLQDQHLAEEALHDVMLVVIDHVKKLQGRDENAVKSFIYLVTRNVCVDILRKELRYKNAENIEEVSLHLQNEDPQDTLEEKLVIELIAEMQPIYRDVVELIAIYGMTVKECAKALKITPAACRKRLERARAIIREKLKEEESDV